MSGNVVAFKPKVPREEKSVTIITVAEALRCLRVELIWMDRRVSQRFRDRQRLNNWGRRYAPYKHRLEPERRN